MKKKHIRKPYTKKDFAWVSYTSLDIKRVVDRYIEEVGNAYTKIKQIPKGEQTFENTVLLYSGLGEEFNGEDSPLSLLMYLSDKKSVRDVCQKSFEKITTCFLKFSYDKDLYNVFVIYSKNNAKKEKLRDEDKKLLTDIIDSFKKNGINLPEKTQKILQKKSEKLQKIEREFARAVDEYEDEIWVSEKELGGLPLGYKETLQKKSGKYRVSLTYPESIPFVKYAHHVPSRKKLIQKLSKQGGAINNKRLSQMVLLRNEISQLLGYKNFSDITIDDEMAKKTLKVVDFLTQLKKDLKPLFLKEQKELQKYKEKKTGDKKSIEYYESSYYATQYKEEKFSLDEKALREYFPLPHVRDTMFEIFGQLFDVSFSKNTTLPLWHKDVEMYEVQEKRSGALVGYVAFDFFPRKGKFSHMACLPVFAGYEKGWKSEEYKTPFSCIMGNFPKASKKIPSLLSVREVETLFHEFGHSMHCVFGDAALGEQSGTNTTCDFVEIPSQLFEEWFWNDECLSKLSFHYETGEKLPSDIQALLQKSRKFNTASFTYDQVLSSLYDIELYTTKNTLAPHKKWQDTRKKAGFKSQVPGSLFPAGWGHMEGYASKYYSYLWSEVYAKDVFSCFEKEGILNKKLGKKLKKELLSVGSSRSEMESIKAFLGRNPRNTAFIKSLTEGK
ncbi:MAG: thimet oligopeptidase [Flavobacteriaceae bacterium]|jgi:thimet oligopeptidase